MSNNFTIKQVIDIVDKNIEMENKFDCSKVDLMHTIIVQNEKIDKAIEYIKHSQSYGTMAQVMPHLKPYVNGDDLLQILGDKENEET